MSEVHEVGVQILEGLGLKWDKTESLGAWSEKAKVRGIGVKVG